ncbi:cation transporter [Flammeovirga agarivorans]|uniref:Cation transporter n=1 Tax=Flammeovirga agarivorans TaxID=2726742 RepID=A0A7X8SL14_9BACT|nr:cation transporter [Flammeovirga agarivorans]NLR92078.1 cation transporter [Flammeovirga agarivorans]
MNSFQQNQSVEVKTLRIGAIVNLLMAIGGWIAYSITSSEALLLDGNFSFIACLVTVLAEFISKAKHRKTATFPFGSYAYEAFFILFKGILILGIIVSALFQNSIKIIDYLNGASIDIIDTSSILIYILSMTTLSVGMMLFIYLQNKKVNGSSDILNVELQSLKIDALLSVFSGLALIIFSMIATDSPFSFLLYIGDSIIVLLMCLSMINTPFQIIRDAAIELGGGVVQHKEYREKIETIISDTLPDLYQDHDLFITKLGTNFFVVAYVQLDQEMVFLDQMRQVKDDVHKELNQHFESANFELVFQ